MEFLGSFGKDVISQVEQGNSGLDGSLHAVWHGRIFRACRWWPWVESLPHGPPQACTVRKTLRVANTPVPQCVGVTSGVLCTSQEDCGQMGSWPYIAGKGSAKEESRSSSSPQEQLSLTFPSNGLYVIANFPH
eukprot:4147239-Amphidinium_carterae.1